MLSSPQLRQRLAAEEVMEARAWEREQLDKQIAEDTARERAVFNEHLFEVQHGMSRHEWERLRQAQRDEQVERDLRAPYGSPGNPATLIGGTVLDPRPARADRRGY
jgi:hypothetical protein